MSDKKPPMRDVPIRESVNDHGMGRRSSNSVNIPERSQRPTPPPSAPPKK